MFLKNVNSIVLSCLFGAGISFLLNLFNINSHNSAYGIAFLALLFFILNCIYIFHSRKESFSQAMLLGISVKLLICFVIVVLYSVLNHIDFFNFAIHFVLNYFLFTIFEIRYLLLLIKNNSTKKTAHEK